MTKTLITALAATLLFSAALVGRDAISGKPGGGDTGRFIVLSEFNDQAVQDTRTGLIWQRNPGEGTWQQAFQRCGSQGVGNGELGWRLPNVHEVGSLLDRDLPFPRLPAGHPFGNPNGSIWTSVEVSNGTYGHYYLFNLADIYGQVGVSAATGSGTTAGVWCVRSDL